MARKRQQPPYFPNHTSPSLPKKPRFKPSSSSAPKTPLNEEPTIPTRPTSSMVVVNGLSNGCSVLNLKSRLEMYGSISRIRIENDTGYVNFRSKDSAEAAIAASVDPSVGIVIDSQKVILSLPNDPDPQWREGVRLSVKERLTSKLLQPEVPLSRHGRGNRLGTGSKPRLDLSYKPRDIIAYDDLF